MKLILAALVSCIFSITSLISRAAMGRGDELRLSPIQDIHTGFAAQGLGLASNTIDDEVMVVWSESFGGSPIRYGLVGQRISNSGELIGIQQTYFEPVPPGSFFWESHPEISYSSLVDRYLLTSEVRDDSRFPDRATKGRILLPDGEQTGNSFLVSTAGLETAIAGVPESTEQLVVSRAYPTNPGIYGQTVNFSDASVSATYRLDTGPTGVTTRSNPDVAFAEGANVFLATWRRFVPYQSLEGQLLYHDGVPLGDPFQIATNSDGRLASETAYDTHRSHFLVAYEIGSQVRGQFVDTAGQLLNSSFTLFDHPLANVNIAETPFSLVFDAAQDVYLLATIEGGSQDRLVVEALSPNGDELGIPVEVGRANYIESVELTSIGNGKFYLAWMSADVVGYQTDVYGAVLRLVPEPTSVQIALFLAILLALGPFTMCRGLAVGRY